jgi:hypothetical protein
MSLLSKRLLFVPEPVPTRKGLCGFRYSGRPITLFPFYLGETHDDLSPQLKQIAASALGLIHAEAKKVSAVRGRAGYPALMRLNWSENPMWNWDQLRSLAASNGSNSVLRIGVRQAREQQVSEVVSYLPHILGLKALCISWIREGVDDGLPFGPVHGDFASRNILFRREMLSAVIDWDDCRSEWFAWDLAKTLGEFCLSTEDGRLDYTGLTNFIATYILSAGFCCFLRCVHLLRLIWIVRYTEVLHSLGDALRGEVWYPSYTLTNIGILHGFNLPDAIQVLDRHKALNDWIAGNEH